jgi:hypothetical protein
MSKYPWMGIAAALTLCPAVLIAQQAPQGSSAQATQQTASAPSQSAKPGTGRNAKVWTDDDISSIRTPADDYIDHQREQALAAPAPAKQQQSVAAKPVNEGKPPLLSNPKTVEDANRMIAWEQRDIDSQQKFLEKLQAQLASAPPDQQAHLQSWIQHEIKTIADTKKEKAGLEAQKAELEKKATSKNTTAGQPPSE